MYDNKIRLSQDVLEKAEVIAAEWGLKNARAAVEAVFRKYADEYLYGRCQNLSQGLLCPASTHEAVAMSVPPQPQLTVQPNGRQPSPSSTGVPMSVANIQSSPLTCEAIDALDDLLAL